MVSDVTFYIPTMCSAPIKVLGDRYEDSVGEEPDRASVGGGGQPGEDVLQDREGLVLLSVAESWGGQAVCCTGPCSAHCVWREEQDFFKWEGRHLSGTVQGECDF